MKYEEMHLLDVHPGWSDGRQRYLQCRLNAMLDPTIKLRAELIWNDNYRKAPVEKVPYSAWEYSDPELTLEPSMGDIKVIKLKEQDAVSLMRGDPKDILRLFKDEIEGLKKVRRS